jgi:hypothetical protein
MKPTIFLPRAWRQWLAVLPAILALPAYTQTRPPDYFLRLAFGAPGRLKAWKKLAR